MAISANFIFGRLKTTTKYGCFRLQGDRDITVLRKIVEKWNKYERIIILANLTHSLKLPIIVPS